jgi:hypothetical protein
MSYAKAIYSYQTGVIGDLELQVDDIIEVNYKSNDQKIIENTIISGFGTS